MKAVIFDMYGVIIKHPEGGLVPFLESVNPNVRIGEVYANWVKGDAGLITSEQFFSSIGFKDNAVKIAKEYLDFVEINEDFYEAARVIKKNFRMGFLSNDFGEWSSYLRERFDINKYFDACVVSGDVKITKPDPRIYEMILDKLALPANECIFVDDRRRNLSAAESLGMDTVLFNSRNVEYSGKVINSFGELLNILRNSERADN